LIGQFVYQGFNCFLLYCKCKTENKPSRYTYNPLRRVLIITYYWPPSGGSAVLRWLKFSKYLRDFGWEPVIYTPLNPEPQETDESLLLDIPEKLEVIKRKIIEPYSIYKFLTGRKQHEKLGVALMDQGKKKGFMGKFSLWIRSNLFIPDPRIFWIRPSINFLTGYLKHNPVDAVVTTGPPHSMHLIGLGLKKKTGIKWLADFRDPWTNIDFYKELSLTAMADSRHKKLEKKVLTTADHIITVSPGMTMEFKSYGVSRISTITNGFDDSDVAVNRQSFDKFSILHLGSMPKSRNPENLWKVLSKLANQNPGFSSGLQIRLIGKADQSVLDSLTSNKLDQFVLKESYVPHNQTASILAETAILLLCINNTPNAQGILTNKFFEYLAANRPIIAIGPEDGDAAYILNKTLSGQVFGYDETDRLEKHITGLFEQYTSKSLVVKTTGIEEYSRRNLTKELSELLNNL
jgi:glycosyltransferase involved in cell wall biosynthesis